MSYLKIITVSLLALTISVGCSKKKEDAQKLADQLQQTADSIAVDSLRQDSIDQAAIAQAEIEAAALVAAEELANAMPAKPEGDGYSVQVASCESEDYARYLIDLYTERGYEPFTTQISIEGQTFYRVRIGLFEFFGEARSLQKELVDKYSLDCWIDMVSQ